MHQYITITLYKCTNTSRLLVNYNTIELYQYTMIISQYYIYPLIHVQLIQSIMHVFHASLKSSNYAHLIWSVSSGDERHCTID